MTYISVISLYWFLSASVGVLYTTRNAWINWGSFQILRELHVTEDLIIAAFTPLRNNLAMLYLHLVFVPLGLVQLRSAPNLLTQHVWFFPPIDGVMPYVSIPNNPTLVVYEGMLIILPLLFIVISAAQHADRVKAIRLSEALRKEQSERYAAK